MLLDSRSEGAAVAKLIKKSKLTPIPKYRPGKAARGAGQTAAPSAPSDPAPDLGHIAEALRPLAVRIADMAFLADNALDHDDGEIADMRETLQRRGQLLPLVINRRFTPPVVLGGNKRLRAMLAENWQWAAVVNVDLVDDDAAALALELNATQGQAWNRDLLRKALERVGKLALGERCESLFSRLAEAQKLIPLLGQNGEVAENAGPQMDRGAALQSEWKTELGQLWTIPSKTVPGKAHRLLCGDSTKAADVARVMGGEKAAVLVTDPPYGIALENHAAGKERRNRSFAIAGDDSQSAGESALALAGDVPRLVFASPMKPWTGKWKQFLVWDKGGAVGGGGDKDAYWKGTWELIQVGGTGKLNGQRDNAVLEFHVTGASFEDHPAQKPIKLLAYLLEKISQPGEIAYEPFAGSGSQFFAAEQTGRLCYGLEISAGYVAVCLERLSKLGLEPKLLETRPTA